MLEFLKERVIDELADALLYMEKAIECKPKPCSQVMYADSLDEVKHANNLLKMFQEIEKTDDVTDTQYSTMLKSILTAYSDTMGKYEKMKKLYWS